MLDLEVCLLSAAVAATVMGVAWVVSLFLHEASVADVAWGPALAAIALVCALAGRGSPRDGLLLGLVASWAARLAIHIASRNRGEAEDRRYAALRARAGESFALRSLWSIFGLQAAIAWVVALPIQSSAADPTPDGVGAVALAGAGLALAGLVLEAIADRQLDRFRSDPDSAGEVMDRGLWSWSRHPNYFGDATFWWGVWLVAVEAGSPWWTAAGPVVMTVILVRVTGKPLLEADIGERRPGYAEYVQRTSAFVPRPPAKLR